MLICSNIFIYRKKKREHRELFVCEGSYLYVSPLVCLLPLTITNCFKVCMISIVKHPVDSGSFFRGCLLVRVIAILNSDDLQCYWGPVVGVSA